MVFFKIGNAFKSYKGVYGTKFSFPSLGIVCHQLCSFPDMLAAYINNYIFCMFFLLPFYIRMAYFPNDLYFAFPSPSSLSSISQRFIPVHLKKKFFGIPLYGCVLIYIKVLNDLVHMSFHTFLDVSLGLVLRSKIALSEGYVHFRFCQVLPKSFPQRFSQLTLPAAIMACL